MKNWSKRIISSILSIVLIFSLVLSEGTVERVRAAQNDGVDAVQAEGTDDNVDISDVGIMNIVSRRVTNSNLYSNVPEEQKSVNSNNSVAVVNEVLNVDISGSDIIDYLRFAGATGMPDQRKEDVGAETIEFSSVQTAVAAVADWTNLPVSIDGGAPTVTATNFRGEGAELTFRIPTIVGEKRSLEIYAGGHPGSGTIEAAAKIGNKAVAIKAGNVTDVKYAITPNSSQVTEYVLDYTGTGEDITIVLKLSGTQGISWAGISVAAVVLRDTGEVRPDNPTEGKMIVKEKVVSKSSIYANVPELQKTVTPENPVAVENRVITVDLGSDDVVDYLHFTGDKEPVRKSYAGPETIAFASTESGISAIADWENLSVVEEDGRAAASATNFLGENSTVSFSVPTIDGEKRILDIYAGGHPNTGTYEAKATLGSEELAVIAGETESNSYTYTPNSSQIVHYQITYIGNGQDLSVNVFLSNTGNVSWAGIGVALVVLRKDISALSPQSGSFNKSETDAEYDDLSTMVKLAGGVSFKEVRLNDELLFADAYSYDEGIGTLTFKMNYLKMLNEGNYEFKIYLSNGDVLDYSVIISDAGNVPRPYVKDKNSLYNSDLNAWKLWYRDEFDDSLNDWWEPSYLKWWNYSSESNEKYNVVEYSELAGSNVLKQFTTEDMRADSIVTRRDNFRNPGITLGVRDLIHNYGAQNLTNYQHMPTDDRGATAYGYFEIRAKITGGTTSKTQSGSSAWWFTGFQDAPWQTVEVDMVEYGYGVSEANLNAHFASPMHKWRDPFVTGNNSTWNSTDKNLNVPKPADDYHVYGFEWTPDGMNGYFDGVLVWSKKMSVNYRMLMWISLNSHAYETYTTDAKSHYIDYVRIWKTNELEELEKKLVTKNIVQKQAPVEGNIATLAYSSANGVRSSHYQTYDCGYMNDGDENTSYRAMTDNERSQDTYPVTPYNSNEHYLYMDWVEYNETEIASAAENREVIYDLNGVSYTLASEREIRSPKTIASVEMVVNKNVITKMIDAGRSSNATGTFVYNEEREIANLFPYVFDIEYSEDGYNGWIPIAANIKAQWDFNDEGKASFIVNFAPVQNVNHIRFHVKSVWNSDDNQEVSTGNGFYVAEIKVYETSKGETNAAADDYNFNHAAYAEVSVTDENGNPGSEDINFPICDVADGVYVNEFRSSGDGTRLSSNANRVDTSIENIPDYPQYINFKWDGERFIDSFGLTIGYSSSAPTAFSLQALQEDGTWKTIVTANETWIEDFETKTYRFNGEKTTQMRVEIQSANKGAKIEYNGGIEGNASRVVRIAGGYYSIAEIELNETKEK